MDTYIHGLRSADPDKNNEGMRKNVHFFVFCSNQFCIIGTLNSWEQENMLLQDRSRLQFFVWV